MNNMIIEDVRDILREAKTPLTRQAIYKQSLEAETEREISFALGELARSGELETVPGEVGGVAAYRLIREPAGAPGAESVPPAPIQQHRSNAGNPAGDNLSRSERAAKIMEILAAAPATTGQLKGAFPDADPRAVERAIYFLRDRGYIASDGTGQPWRPKHAAAPARTDVAPPATAAADDSQDQAAADRELQATLKHIEVDEILPPGGAMCCALWSDGRLTIQRKGQMLEFSRAETDQLFQYLTAIDVGVHQLLRGDERG